MTWIRLKRANNIGDVKKQLYANFQNDTGKAFSDLIGYWFYDKEIKTLPVKKYKKSKIIFPIFNMDGYDVQKLSAIGYIIFKYNMEYAYIKKSLWNEMLE